MERYVELAEAGDIVGGLRQLFAEDVVEEIPQSGERIIGRAQVVDVVENHPQRPTISGSRVIGIGDIFAIEAKHDYAGEPWLAFELFYFDSDKVVKAVRYYCQPFDPPEWRADRVEHM